MAKDTKKCDNCQQSNSEGYYKIKKGGKVVLNFCKECVKCHDCKQKEGQELWTEGNKELYLCHDCKSKRQNKQLERSKDIKCSHCQQWLLYVKKEGMDKKHIYYYKVSFAGKKDMVIGEECCWKKAEKNYRQKKPNAVIDMNGKLTEGQIVSEREQDIYRVGGGRHIAYNYKKKEWVPFDYEGWSYITWDKNKLENYMKDFCDPSVSSNNGNNNRERERERETNPAITNSDCWVRSHC